MLSIGFGLWTRQWRLAAQGMLSMSVATVLLVIGGVVVGLLSDPPVRYSECNSGGTGVLISCVVGIAAGLATADDVGRREVIGLAATAQGAIVPAWLGLGWVLGFPVLDPTPPSRRFLGLLLNIAIIVLASLITYALMGVKGAGRKCCKTDATSS